MPISRTATGLLFRDTFDRPDATTLGANWTVHGAAVVTIAANRAQGSTTNEGNVALNAIAARERVYLQTVGNRPTTTNIEFGLMALVNPANGTNGYLWQLYADATTLNLYRHSSLGSFAAVASATVAAVAGGTDFLFQALHADGLQRAWMNGVQVISAADTLHDATTGTAGIRSTVGLTTYDNYTVCTDNRITATGLPTGYQLRAGGRTATESGGTATLDIGGLTLPLAGVEILDTSGAVAETFVGDTWGGDAFARANTAPTVSIDQGATATVGINQTLQLTATTTDLEGAVSVAWSSDNPAVATVSSTGLVTWVSPGTATITATATDAGGLTATDTIAITAIAYLMVGGVVIPTAIRSDNEEAQKGGFTTARSYQGQMYPEGRWVKRKWSGKTIPLNPTLAATIRAKFLSLKPLLCSGTMLRAEVQCYIEHTEANAPFIDPATGVYYPDGKVFSFTLTEK